MRRVQSVDALRGLVMIVMALDHVRDFFHSAAQQFSPEDLTRTWPALFFTRWITHFCAPTFMFTAGIGAYFWLRNNRTPAELSRFLWSRGLWLLFLELTAIRFALSLNMIGPPVLLITLWSLGCSMLALGFLSRLPIRILACVSLLGIALHNLADGIPAARFGDFAWLWNILHQQGAFKAAGILVVAGYPLIPWIFVMSAGFCFGPLVSNPKWLIRIGATATATFLILRTLKVYGDARPFTGTVLSFFNVTKQPPSLDFLLMTLGPAILIMAWFSRFTFSKSNPLMVFGRVPLFYFILHLYAAHLLAVVLRPPAGYNLAIVYLIWIAIVAAFYPLCRWFASLKERRKDWWLSYL